MNAVRRTLAAPLITLPMPGEIANVATHGAGLILSLAGLQQLLAMTHGRGTAGQHVGLAIYGVSAVALYLASTWYHAVAEPQFKTTLRTLDHASIFLLIAGTYTPFLLTLPGPFCWIMLSTIWGLCAVGVAFKVFCGLKYERISLCIYLTMGWLGVITIKPLAEQITAQGIGWLLIGGLAYTAGTAFYVRTEMRHSHAIWHVFVLLGSGMHYVAVSYYVVPSFA